MSAELSLQCISDNIQQGNYEKKVIFAHANGLLRSFDVSGRFAVTCAGETNSVRLWDIETGQPYWTFKPNPKVWWTVVSIVDQKIVCGGKLMDKDLATIRILNIVTGKEEHAIDDPEMDIYRTRLVGNRIVGLLQNTGTLTEWDHMGVRTLRNNPQAIDNSYFHHSSYFKASDQFGIKYNRSTIEIYYRETDQHRTVQVESGNRSICSLFILGHHLFCGMSLVHGQPQCYVVDLKDGKVIGNYAISNVFVNYVRKDAKSQDYWNREEGHISSVLADHDYLYLGHSSGKLARIPLKEPEKGQFLGSHYAQIEKLAFLNNMVLISGSSQDDWRHSTLIFWDRKTGQQLNEQPAYCLFSLSCQNAHTVTFAATNALIQLKFNVKHEGEKRTDYKHPETPSES